MQTFAHFRSTSLCLVIILLMDFTFAAFPTKAQTFGKQAMLTATPTNLRVIITALSQSPMLRIRYEKQDNSAIRIQIRDSKGSVVCDELKQQPKYAAEYDMSLLPAGVYRVDLQTNQARYQETVYVKLLGGRYPIVETILPEKIDSFTTQNELGINQLNK